jgi:hypothetical protein
MPDVIFSYELMEESQAGAGEGRAAFYKRTRQGAAVTRSVSERDIRVLLSLGGASVASLLPSRAWLPFGRFVSTLRYGRKRRKGYAAFAEAMGSVLGIDDAAMCETLFRRFLENLARRELMFTIDELARSRNPRIEAAGTEKLRAALDRGRGAIVWASPFVFQTLAGKRALWEQGFRPIQISDTHHGFSTTAFGNVAINPLVRRAEDRYLKERICFEPRSGAAVTRKIVSLLDQGELILLTNNVHAGSMFVEMRFGERGSISMPTGPLSIVARRATPFFSMAILETAPFERMQAVIEPIDDATAAQGRAASRDYARMARLALVARDNLLAQFRRAPDQYLGVAGLGRSKLETR